MPQGQGKGLLAVGLKMEQAVSSKPFPHVHPFRARHHGLVLTR